MKVIKVIDKSDVADMVITLYDNVLEEGHKKKYTISINNVVVEKDVDDLLDAIKGLLDE